MHSDILFDLDGTLVDTSTGIFNAIIYSVNKSGKPLVKSNELKTSLNRPLSDFFINTCGIKKNNLTIALHHFWEYFSKKGFYESSLYPGIRGLLEGLRKKSNRVILTTEKPEPIGVNILKYLDIERYFCHIKGNLPSKTQLDKTMIIQSTITNLRLDKKKCIMVGDCADDIMGAKENKIKSIGVTYGYGTSDELRKQGADLLVQSVATLQYILA